MPLTNYKAILTRATFEKIKQNFGLDTFVLESSQASIIRAIGTNSDLQIEISEPLPVLNSRFDASRETPPINLPKRELPSS